MQKIKELRLNIDEVDQKILALIIERLNLVKKIGDLKKENGIEILDGKREEQVLSKLTILASEKNIDTEIIKKVWKTLMEVSYQIEGEKNGNS